MGFKSYEPAEMMLSKARSVKKGCYTCQWLDNSDMHLYAKFDQNIPCCSRVMSILLADHGRSDSHSDFSADQRVVQDHSADPKGLSRLI